VADMIFDREEVFHERAAHIVDFVDEVGRQSERAAMIMHTVNVIVSALIVSDACEDMDLVLAPLQRRSQFSDMHAHATDRNRM
jgi:hypothetical protein